MYCQKNVGTAEPEPDVLAAPDLGPTASIYSQPPPEWEDLCARFGSFSGRQAWQTVLQTSFGTEYRYLVASDKSLSFIFQIFRVGPFKAGYINFPFGGTLGGHPPLQAHIDRLCHDSEHRVHILNLIYPAFYPTPTLTDPVSVTLPETAITDLATYQLMDRKKIRRDLKRARQFGTQVGDTPSLSDAEVLYDLYRATIARHRGKIRYNLSYFQELLRLAEQSREIKVLTASLDHSVVGFLVLFFNNHGAYYLHGAINHDFAKYGISDLLIARAIEIAKERDANWFNFMASPAYQSSLVRYKEKWGATTADQRHVQRFSHPFWKLGYQLGTLAMDYLRR